MKDAENFMKRRSYERLCHQYPSCPFSPGFPFLLFGHNQTCPLNRHQSLWGNRLWLPQRAYDFDILDDEINQWLIPIYAKTDQVVFVSDSCHSASVTRGKVPWIRAVPIDRRVHPLGKKRFETVKFHSGVLIGAARDDEFASEFDTEDGQSYGMFTYYYPNGQYLKRNETY